MAAPFPKQELITELATIFLFEGDHLALGRGFAFAETFLGFEPEDGSNYFDNDPSRVDLSSFAITGSFDRGYDYAFAPTNPIQLDESEVQDLIVFMDGTPRVGGTSGGGALHTFMTPKGRCQHVADTVFARWKLEIEWAEELTVRDLALLANMTEGAVRNAISIKELKARKRGSSTYFERADALEWLSGRRGFVPMPAERNRKHMAVQRLLASNQRGEFGGRLREALQEAGYSLPEVADRLDWSADDLMRWQQGMVADVFVDAERLARLLQMDETDLISCLRRLAHGPPR